MDSVEGTATSIKIEANDSGRMDACIEIRLLHATRDEVDYLLNLIGMSRGTILKFKWQIESGKEE